LPECRLAAQGQHRLEALRPGHRRTKTEGLSFHHKALSYYFSELLIQRRIHTCHSNIHTIINVINEKKNSESLADEMIDAEIEETKKQAEKSACFRLKTKSSG